MSKIEYVYACDKKGPYMLLDGSGSVYMFEYTRRQGKSKKCIGMANIHDLLKIGYVIVGTTKPRYKRRFSTKKIIGKRR